MTAAELFARVSRWPEAARHPALEYYPWRDKWETDVEYVSPAPAADLHALAGLVWLANHDQMPMIGAGGRAIHTATGDDGWHGDADKGTLFDAVDEAIQEILDSHRRAGEDE